MDTIKQPQLIQYLTAHERHDLARKAKRLAEELEKWLNEIEDYDTAEDVKQRKILHIENLS